jgi:hypothetical protein
MLHRDLPEEPHVPRTGGLLPSPGKRIARLERDLREMRAFVARFIVMWERYQLRCPYAPMLEEEHKDMVRQAKEMLK